VVDEKSPGAVATAFDNDRAAALTIAVSSVGQSHMPLERDMSDYVVAYLDRHWRVAIVPRNVECKIFESDCRTEGMSLGATTPDGLGELIAAAYKANDAKAIRDLYEEDAVLANSVAGYTAVAPIASAVV
jgi:hypothetical protein